MGILGGTNVGFGIAVGICVGARTGTAIGIFGGVDEQFFATGSKYVPGLQTLLQRCWFAE